MVSFLFLAGFALLLQPASCRDFNMWPYMDPDAFSQAMSVDSACLAALNASLPCPEPFMSYSSEVDFYWWGSENLTQICTPACTSALSSWTDSVVQSCGQQNVLLHGSYVKAHTLPLLYSHGHDIACLKSNSGDFCMLQRQGWEGQEAVSYAEDYCLYDEGDGDMPECADPSFDPTAVTPDMTRMANLYSKDLLCSECFLKMFHIRLESPFLPKVNYTDYLLDQWEDMQAVCSTSIALQTKASTLYVGPASTSTAAIAARHAQVTSRAIVTRSIPGYADLGCYTDADSRTLPSDHSSGTDMSLESCASYCSGAGYQIFGVENGNECWCSNEINPSATPQSPTSCTAQCAGNAQEICGGGWAINVYSSTTAAPSSTPTLTPGSLAGYDFVGCYSDQDSRTLGDSSMTDSALTPAKCAAFCGTAAFFGVEYGQECWCSSTLNPIATISTACDKACGGDSQHRCGGGWAIDVYSSIAAQPSGPASTAMPTTTRSSPPAATTCPGQLIKTADENGLPYGCELLAQKYQVTTGSLMFATNDKLCDVDTTVCAPLPCSTDQIGFTETCDSLVKSYYTEANNLTLALFLSWNPNLVGFCQRPLGSQYVCTGPPGGAVALDAPVYNPTGTTGYYTTAIPAQPTPTGTTKSCGLYHGVVQGDVCQTICLRYGISFDQFMGMNPEILPDCSNLWLGYSYCVYNVSAPLTSTDGSCGTQHNNAVCEGSGYGDCCNQGGKCGSGDAYCAADVCQSGKCLNGTLTPDGSCGPSNHYYICADGDCCSIYGFCGNTNDFCGPGNCYSGACDPDEGGISIDGSCGPLFAGNKTCTGSQFGACCSSSGFCGDSDDYCKGSNCYSGACHN